MHDADDAGGTLTARRRASGPTRSQRSRETAELVTRLPGADAAERRDILEHVVLLNVGVARAVARRFRGRGIDLDDLEQTACLALVLAARTFDPARGHDFLTFAVPTIVGGVRHHFRDKGWAIQVPRRVQEVQVLMQRCGLPEVDEAAYGSRTVERLAGQLQLSRPEVEAALRARGCFRPGSLADGGERSWSVGGSTLAWSDDHEAVELRSVLAPLIDRLAPRDRQLLRLRFGEDRTQESIASELQLTQAQVSRLLTRVIRELRDGLDHEEIADVDPVTGAADVVVSLRQPA